jgi:hypothetical protein
MAFVLASDLNAGDPMGSDDSNYVRPPVVAGAFYPGAPTELAKMLAGFFHAAPKPRLSGKPMAIIAPHAGYIYSGQIAARAYKILEGEDFNTVIVISPSHSVYFKGVSAFGGKAYVTPLGEIPVNHEMTKEIAAGSDVVNISNIGHEKSSGRSEHALEVQLPFMQTALGKFSLVALVMGDQDYQTCRALGKAVADAIGKRDDVLIVASTDLSHFHSSSTASRLDSVARKDIGEFDYEALADDLDSGKTEACGGGPVISAMIAAGTLGANSVEITGFGDSGDNTGDKSNVVGYLSAIIYRASKAGAYEIEDAKPEPRADFGLDSNARNILLCIARQAIEAHLDFREMVFPQVMPETLTQNLGAFVTLHEHGDLRGCIGTFQAREPLYRTVAAMAQEAAFSDFRFRPVSKEELSTIDIEISVLTPMNRICDPESVMVGSDGLYIKRGRCAGVLLPQVPLEQGWDRATFLDHTCLKAGLPPGSWRDTNTELYVFQADIFSER